MASSLPYHFFTFLNTRFYIKAYVYKISPNPNPIPNACYHLNKYPNLEDDVQKHASRWNMYLSLSYLIPAILSDIFLGAWSDRKGRKISILIGFAGLITTSVAFTTLAVFPLMPLYILILANIVAGFTGYVAIILISSIAYLTDVVTNKETLTFRMIIVMIFRWLSDIIGSFTTSILLKISNPAVTMLFAQIFFALGFFYALARLRQMEPERLRKLTRLEEENRNGIIAGSIEKGDQNGNRIEKPVDRPPLPVVPLPLPPKNSRGCCVELGRTCRFVRQLYKEVWRTLARPRKYHRRAHIFICTTVYFCFCVSEVGLQSGPIMSLYVFHRPFYWSPSALGMYRGVQSVVSFAACIIGAIINKYMKLDDTTMMLWSLASGFIHLTLVGLSRWTWMLYLAAIIGSFQSLIVPSVKALTVRVVDGDEVGKVLAANGIAADLAFVCSTLIFTNIYSATVTTYAGSVFLIAASTLVCCFGAVLWMRFDRRRQKEIEILDETNEKLEAKIRPVIEAANYSMTFEQLKNSEKIEEGKIDVRL